MRFSTDSLFRVMIVVSLLAHGAFLAYGQTDFLQPETRGSKIPVKLMQPPPPPPELPPPPPPPPPPPELPPPPEKPKPKKKKLKPPRPELPPQVEKVQQSEGLTTGQLVDADVGEYDKDAEPEYAPPPPPPPPPKIDTVKLTREYLAKLRKEFMENKKYPVTAQKMGIRGTVTVSFTILADSTFTDIKIKKSSNHRLLDDAAVETVEMLSGSIKRPKEIGDKPLRTSVALVYELN